MRPFLHDRLRRLEGLLTRSTAAMDAYRAHDVALDSLVAAFLTEAGAQYRAMGLTEAENDIAGLHAQVAAAETGIHPETLERVARRREFARSVALRVLLAGAHRLRDEHARIGASLEEFREQLVPLVGYAWQAGLVVPRAEYSQAELSRLWHALGADAGSRAAARQVAMRVNDTDVLLLLDELLRAPVAALAPA